MELVLGYWQIIAVRFLNLEQQWESEELIGGSAIVTRSGDITIFTRTTELAFAYCGKYTIRGNDFVIVPDACTIPELEKTTLVRTITSVTQDAATLRMFDEPSGRHYEMDFKILTREFV